MRIVSFHDLSGAISFESNTPAVAEVVVWATRSLLTHTTVSPNATLRACGRNCMPSIVTVCVTGRRAAAAAGPMAHSVTHREPANIALRMPVWEARREPAAVSGRDAPQIERSGHLEPHRCAHRAIRRVGGFQTEMPRVNVKGSSTVRRSALHRGRMSPGSSNGPTLTSVFSRELCKEKKPP